MATIFDAATLADVTARVRQLQPEEQAKWGTFTAPLMLAHVASAVEYGLRSTFQDKVKGPMAMWPVNKLMIHKVKWPEGKAKSPAVFLPEAPEDWEACRSQLIADLEELSSRGPDATWPMSPVFGRLTGADWGVLNARHLDHHLRQFGV